MRSLSLILCIVICSRTGLRAYTGVMHAALFADDSTGRRTQRGDSTSFFSVSGVLTVEGRYTDVRLPLQTTPNNYLRSFLNGTVNAGLLPLQFNAVYSTEHDGTHRINAYRISYSRDALIRNIGKKLANSKPDLQLQAEFDSLSRLQLVHEELVNVTLREFERPEYQEKLVNSSVLVAGIEADTLNKADMEGFRYKESKAFMRSHELKLQDLSLAQSTLRQLERRKNEIRLIRQNRSPEMTAALGDRSLYAGKLPGWYKLALSVRTLEVGKFVPLYNSLVADGTALSGINAELNPGIAYVSFSYGTLEYSSNQPMMPRLAGEQASVYWLRAGLRQEGRFSMVYNQVLTVLPQPARIGEQLFFRQIINALDLNYRYKAHQFLLELAQSDYGKNDVPFFSVRDPRNSRLSYGIKGQYQARLAKKGSVDLKLRSSYIAPAYSSYSAPFMRKDNLKYEVSLGGSLLRQVLRLELGARHEQDNFFRTQPVSNDIRVYSLSGILRYRNYPYLILQVSPGYNIMTSLADHHRWKQAFSVYSLSSGYAGAAGKVNYSLSAYAMYATYSQVLASDSLSYRTNYQAGTSARVQLKKYEVEVYGNASVTWGLSHERQFSYETRLVKKTGRMQLGAGYLHARDLLLNTFESIYGTLGATAWTNMLLNFKAGYNTLLVPSGTGDPGQGLCFTLTIQKTF